jgi:hypothetical protein
MGAGRSNYLSRLSESRFDARQARLLDKDVERPQEF